MNDTRIFIPALTAFCIMAFFIAGAVATGTPGQAGQGSRNNAAGSGGSQAYTIGQTISDQAQQNTLAFDGLAFVTGDACSDTFLPPGKVADYAGFQYLRDNDATQMGHNTDFVTRASDNVLVILNDDQLAQFVALSKTEAPLTTKYALMRFPLTTAFRNAYTGNIPSGSSGLDRVAVMDYSAELYGVDADISIARAKTYASVINSLNGTQRAHLDSMKSGGMLSWPVADATEVLTKSGQGNSVAMRTYASEMFAWYAGSVDADVYFCPERQATYFGSFYMKDRPAMGNAGYSISTSLTGDSGEGFLNLLTADQREKITGLVDLQRPDLNEIVATRTAIATELRRPLSGGMIDEAKVRSLSAWYGELDGEISYLYATHFADVGNSLSADQKVKMVALRNLGGYSCEGAYLYSQPIAMPQDIPSAFLFGIGKYDAAAVSSWIDSLKLISGVAQPGSQKAGPAQANVTGKRPGNSIHEGNASRPGIWNGPSRENATDATRQGKGNNPRPGNSAGNMTEQSPVPARNVDNESDRGIPGWLVNFWQSLWGRPSQMEAPQERPQQPGNKQQGPVPSVSTAPATPVTGSETFALMSSAIPYGGRLPVEYSCDGDGLTPALSWSGAPEGTKEFALIMTTIPVDGSTRWNWVMYGIPASATGLAKDSTGVGSTGTGSHGTVMQYDPPCPQGPGDKTYTLTLFALSGSPALPASAEQVTGQVLSDAIKPVTLAKTSLNVSYGRS